MRKIKIKTPLNKQQIADLILLICDLNHWIDNKRSINNLAQNIQYAKTPSILSESLARLLIIDKRILVGETWSSINLGGNKADLIGINAKGNRKFIEVKATVEDFSSFGIKDINADYLIWIDLKNIFRNNNCQVIIYEVKKPYIISNKTSKISLSSFINRSKKNLTVTNLDLCTYLSFAHS